MFLGVLLNPLTKLRPILLWK